MVAGLSNARSSNVALPELADELDRGSFARLKRHVIAGIGPDHRTVHAARIFHKDLYLCHFYLDRG